MKICKKCGTLYVDKLNFCSICGETLEVYQEIENATDISNEINVLSETQQQSEETNTLSENNSYISSVKNDLMQSESIKKLKKDAIKTTKKAKKLTDQGVKKFKNVNKKKKILITIAAVLITLFAVVLNIHICEDCEDVYFGKQYHYMGSDICEECYRDYTTFNWNGW